MRSFCAFLVIAVSGTIGWAQGLGSGDRVVFVGDSITNAGHYISEVEAQLRMSVPDAERPQLLNLGLPSETCTGLSEPDHPFPRPNVHERLGRVLAKARPKLLVVCYGMNDGIYHPFSEERFKAYREGLDAIIRKGKAAGAKVVLLTPPPFDPQPMGKAGKLRPADAEKFSWMQIFEDYADVIRRYAEHVMTLGELVDGVVDVHSPISEYTATRRKEDPEYAMSKDGVHMNEEGHRIMAHTILRAVNVEPVEVPAAVLKKVHERQMLLHHAWLTHTGHTRPGVVAGRPLAEAEAGAKELDAEIAALIASGGEPTTTLFNGESLEGWDGDANYWSVVDGMIRGANDEGVVVPSSTYLFTRESYRNFRLRLEVKQTMSNRHSTMHSAVAALGERFADKGDNAHGFKGPLLMCCHDWGIWDAYRRNRTVPANHRGTLKVKAEKPGEWDDIEILVKGDRIRFAVNGHLIFDFTDKPGMLKESPIGLQLHSNRKPQEFWFRNIRISEEPGDGMMTVR